MDRYTFETKKWLDLRFDPGVHTALGIPWRPFSPIFGFPAENLGANEFLATARWVRLLGLLDALCPASFLDVGGAEGFVGNLVCETCPGTFVAVGDLSIEAARRAREFSGLPSAAFDAAALPFADASFDVVFMSEVLEHLANPLRAILELKRVAKKAVIVTTEAFAIDEQKRLDELAERRFKPHMDRSIFCPGDFDVFFFDCDRRSTNQASRIPAPPPTTLAGILAAMPEVTATDDLAWPAHGIIFAASKEGPLPRPTSLDAGTLAVLHRKLSPRTPAARYEDRAIDPGFLARLRCPECRGEVSATTSIECRGCGLRFAVVDGCADLATSPGRDFFRSLVEEARRAGLDGAKITELERLEEKLAFDLDPVVSAERLLPDHADRFSPEHSTPIAIIEGQIEVDGEVDPAILSPRLNRSIEDIHAIEIEIAVDRHPDPEFLLQVYFWTLERPFFHEGACAVARASADGAFRRLAIEIPHGFPAGDELIRLRIDPCVGRGRARIRAVDIRTA